MDRKNGEQPLCRKKGSSYFPPMTPLSSAATMRSLHSEASTHHRYGPFVSAPCLTLTGTTGATLCSRCGSHASTFLPPVPRRVFAFRAFSGSPPQRPPDFCTAHLPYRSPRLPRHTFLSFRLQPRELPGHRFTHHPSVSSEFRASLMASQARRSPPPNRVRYPTDQQFASGLSVPSTADRLLSTPPRGDAVSA